MAKNLPGKDRAKLFEKLGVEQPEKPKVQKAFKEIREEVKEEYTAAQVKESLEFTLQAYDAVSLVFEKMADDFSIKVHEDEKTLLMALRRIFNKEIDTLTPALIKSLMRKKSQMITKTRNQYLDSMRSK